MLLNWHADASQLKNLHSYKAERVIEKRGEAMEEYRVEVEESVAAVGRKPSAGPVYRCVYAKNGFLQLPAGIDSPWNLFCKSVKRFPQRQMLGHRQIVNEKASAYIWQSYEQAYEKAIKIGTAMRRCGGLCPGDRCGIYGSNCPEWLIVMEACYSQGICYVPLYDTLGADAIEFILNHAEVSFVFIQENKIPFILKSLPGCSAFLRTIVSFGIVTGEQKKEAEKVGVNCFSWNEFISSEFNESCELPSKSKDDVCTIIYTSGTTGEPKGVVLSNKVVVAQVLNIEYLLLETDKVLTEEDSYLSFLPLAHVFDQIMENYCIYKGASIGFWQGDVRRLMEDIQELKPTLFCGVPRVYERIYTGINQKIQSGGILAKKIFEYAYQHKLKNLMAGFKQDQASPFFDKLVFNKIRQGLGGRIRLMLSGAAPVPKHVEEFFRVTSCSVFLQGYGLTESGAGCFTSIANVFPMMGTVGVPVPTIEARLESVPEMGYDALSATPQGEICLRGTTLFSGYHKRQDLTDEAFVDGWFHTGDIGEWQPGGAMKIIDRKKNIFKLSQGEYVAVENIESAYCQCSLVASIWVYGSSFESFLVAVAIPERKALEDWAESNQVTAGSFEELCEHHKAREYVLKQLNKTGQMHRLRGFELLKAVHLESRPFDMERDLITPTFKLKRAQLIKCYKDVIDELYVEAKGLKA
ncbi:long chain acyl-CoA synthetase 2 [Phalaenopsis equestris]|uniref:long chain acyl-CoA synthetase 2 n=1 Tax=Phalaenopsis equestris TaxID=78828 RepID=UPI0009E34507|nr:long chain acyl-CoA synthetase 2 [Phalaenopsis equestris]